VERLGKFVLEQKLGAGAGGDVWRALDTELNRPVALKILRSADPGEITRFEREARTAAKLDHPGICSVFEVGEADHRRFIAMRLVDGPTLKQWTGPRADLVRLLRDAALAVAHAHDRGIVHRDLKPENLMIENGRIVVTDFGLARPVEGSLSGAITGTPAFMPPEQARGDRAGARSDVYSLGATLYERLTGRPPHLAGSLPETLRLIQEEAPVAPRAIDPSIDPALEAVVLTCLEKDPARRYDSATALAEDLDHVLCGEPVRFRPARLVAWAGRRRRALLAVTGALIVVLAAAIAIGPAHVRRRAAEKDALRRLEAASAACLEAALELRRAGNVTAMARYADELESLCRDVAQKAPHSPEPHYRLGRMHRARMRSRDAIEEQELALARDPSHAGARFERGLLRVGLYEQRLDVRLGEGLMRLGEAALAQGRGVVLPRITRVSLEDDEARRLRDGALADLRGLAHPLVPALIAWLGEKDREARTLFERAVGQGPDGELAHAWLGRLVWDEGDPTAARSWFTRGIDADRGYALHWSARARVVYDTAARLHASGGDALALFDAAADDARQACRLQPENGESWGLLGLLLSTASAARSLRGGDGEPAFREALHACGVAIRLRPGDPRLWQTRGRLLYDRATRIDRAGGDAEPDYRAARADVDEAVRLQPLRSDAWILRGDVNGACAARLQRAGLDPADLAELAARDYREAMRRDPSRDEPWSGLGMLSVNRGDARMAFGVDPTGDYAEAARAFREAARLAPRRDEPWHRLGAAMCQQATWLVGAGRDPSATVDEGIAALDAAASLNPSRGITYSVRGSLRIALAQWRTSQRRDAAPVLAEARLDMDRAVKADPGDADAWFNRANLCFWQGRLSPDDDAPLEEAVDNYGRALSLHPLHTRAQVGRASARGELGARTRARGGDPSALYASAIGELRALVAREPRIHEGWYYLGHTWWNLAVHKNLANVDFTTEAREALAAWTEAVKLHPAYRDTVAEPMELCRRIHQLGRYRPPEELLRLRVRLPDEHAHAVGRLRPGRPRLPQEPRVARRVDAVERHGVRLPQLPGERALVALHADRRRVANDLRARLDQPRQRQRVALQLVGQRLGPIERPPGDRDARPFRDQPPRHRARRPARPQHERPHPVDAVPPLPRRRLADRLPGPLDVRVRRPQPALRRHERVGRAHLPRDVVRLVRRLQRRLLVRDRDARARELPRRDGLAQPRAVVQPQLHRPGVQPELVEDPVEDRGRPRVGHRVADHRVDLRLVVHGLRAVSLHQRLDRQLARRRLLARAQRRVAEEASVPSIEHPQRLAERPHRDERRRTRRPLLRGHDAHRVGRRIRRHRDLHHERLERVHPRQKPVEILRRLLEVVPRDDQLRLAQPDVLEGLELEVDVVRPRHAGVLEQPHAVSLDPRPPAPLPRGPAGHHHRQRLLRDDGRDLGPVEKVGAELRDVGARLAGIVHGLERRGGGGSRDGADDHGGGSVARIPSPRFPRFPLRALRVFAATVSLFGLFVSLRPRVRLRGRWVFAASFRLQALRVLGATLPRACPTSSPTSRGTSSARRRSPSAP
jgi:serine/threonine-protein kinase